MGFWENVRVDIKSAISEIQKNPILDAFAKSALESIPVIGGLLLNLYDNASDKPEDKTEQILTILKNYEKLTGEKLEKACRELESDRQLALQNKEYLKLLVDKTEKMAKEIGEMKDAVGELTPQIRSGYAATYYLSELFYNYATEFCPAQNEAMMQKSEKDMEKIAIGLGIQPALTSMISFCRNADMSNYHKNLIPAQDMILDPIIIKYGDNTREAFQCGFRMIAVVMKLYKKEIPTDDTVSLLQKSLQSLRVSDTIRNNLDILIKHLRENRTDFASITNFLMALDQHLVYYGDSRPSIVELKELLMKSVPWTDETTAKCTMLLAQISKKF